MNQKIKKGILTISALIFLWWLLLFDLRVYQLNSLLDSDEAISNYPYSFKVVSVNGSTATLKSPRSANMPAFRSLKVLFPELRNQSETSEAFVEAQRKLANVQSKASSIIMSQKDIDTITWQLDENWLRQHNVIF